MEILILQGPDVEVDSATIDFGLIEYGETVQKVVNIKNLSPILARCRIKEANKVRD